MALVYTPVCSQGRQLQQWGGLFSLILPTVLIKLPPTSMYLSPWRMHSEDAVLWMMMTCNTACVKNSNASANSFMLLAYSISRDGQKYVLIMKKILWKNNLHAVEDLPMLYVNIITIVIIVSDKNNRHYLCTAARTLSGSTRTLSRWWVMHCTPMSVVIRIKLSDCNLYFPPFLHAMRLWNVPFPYFQLIAW
jgi:hypothetical protein